MKVTKELQTILKHHPEHSHVYFDTFDNHYFNVFPQLGDIIVTNNEIVGKKEGIDYKLYGCGEFHSRRIIPGIHNVEQRTEVVSKGKPSTLIVDKMSRKDVLAERVEDESLTIVQRIAQATPEELAQIRSLLVATNEKAKPSVKKDTESSDSEI